MKKILLLLIVIFVFVNTSFAYMFSVCLEDTEEFNSTLYLDSIVFDKDCINYTYSIFCKNHGYRAEINANLHVNSNIITREIIIHKQNSMVDKIKMEPIYADNKYYVVFLKTLYKHHKELLLRNIIISFETILLLSFSLYIIYWKRKQKK